MVISKEQEDLENNEYYLLVSTQGYVLKTKFQRDFEAIRLWGGIVFSGIVKNSQYLFFKVGKQILKKPIRTISAGKSQEKTWYYDISELSLKGGTNIHKAWVGKKSDGFEVEPIYASI